MNDKCHKTEYFMNVLFASYVWTINWNIAKHWYLSPRDHLKRIYATNAHAQAKTETQTDTYTHLQTHIYTRIPTHKHTQTHTQTQAHTLFLECLPMLMSASRIHIVFITFGMNDKWKIEYFMNVLFASPVWNIDWNIA